MKYNCEQYKNSNSRHSADDLISNGYLKQKDILDVDGKSYCNAYVIRFMGDNCQMEYELYLKCNDYQTPGYVNW